MSQIGNDVFKEMNSIVRIEPTVSLRFLVEELRRYGIKTNNKSDKGKTVFYQSAHLIVNYNTPGEDDILYPSYGIVSFKDLFTLIGKNESGADDQDIVRVWYICEKLEKRNIVKILGTANEELKDETRPELPNVYANMHHIHRNDNDKDNYNFKSKFATGKKYKTVSGGNLIGVADYFIVE